MKFKHFYNNVCFCVEFNKEWMSSSMAVSAELDLKVCTAIRGFSTVYHGLSQYREPVTDEYKSTSVPRLLTFYVYYRQE